jgi:YD repeat-containing protein
LLSLRLALTLFISFNAHALTVNRLNGSASVIYLDFNVPGAVLPLELARTYNSITAASEQKGWLGAFGWGWTSPFETTLTVTPDRNVLLRDGANGNTVLFRPENEDPGVMASFIDEVKTEYFKKEKNRKLNAGELSKLTLPAKIENRLRKDPEFRSELASKFGIKSQIPIGQVLISSEFGYQTIFQKGDQWIRTRDGITQVFDNDGRLVKQVDKNGFFFTYAYSPSQKFQLEIISDANRTMSLRFKWRNDRIVEAFDNRGNRASYAYDTGNNLIQVTDSNRQIYKYQYSHKKFPHLLTKIDYASESSLDKPVFREIRYDDSALVTFHHEKDGAETTYTYGKLPRDPENNFWTRSVRVFGGAKEETYDEFLIMARADGTKYLHKQDNKTGAIATSTLFTPCCGKPAEITKNGATTIFKYYSNGLLKERVGPKEDIKIEYEPRWKKVTRVTQNGVRSEYSYDGRGNLIRATNSKNEKVGLKYDANGRILEMTDASGKVIAFKYGDIGKPIFISQAGVGAIRIAYDSQGRIKNAETVKEAKSRAPSKEDSREVVRKVMLGFQLLLDVIRPAGMGMNLG